MIATADNRLQHESLSTAAYAEIRKRIVSLQFEPGRRLNVDKLARELGISPTPLREALNRLAVQKLVRVETYKGFTVEPLLDERQLKDLYVVRELLESFAVKSLAAPISRANAAMLRQTITQMEKMTGAKAMDPLRFSEMDHEFHEKIISLCGNEVLVDSFRALNVHTQIARFFQLRASRHAAAANVEHRAIVDAIVAGDLDGAVAALHVHVSNGFERLIGMVRARDQVASLGTPPA